jgi:hypothetical protein
MRPSELDGVDAARIAAAVGGLNPESRHAAVLCADGVAALRRAIRQSTTERPATMT